MTLYHVHLYREMRITFEGIEAETPQSAAAIARRMSAGEAVAIEECGGENLAALIGEAGDDAFERAVSIDFSAERLRGAVPDISDWARGVGAALESTGCVPDRLYVAAILLLSMLGDAESGVDPGRSDMR
ncbi:hypothetical protein [Singulisphaera sp. PoT]|uniref:hypothetical protein n=1 Tax=Singulisphaera sp. PoT TaxID=3411797 RepID=UPI003BF4E5DB